MSATLRLRCLRCGNWADLDPFEMYGWGLCPDCWAKHPDVGMPDDKNFAKAFHRWCDRYQKGMERHPTYKALKAIWDAEAARIGALGDAPW